MWGVVRGAERTRVHRLAVRAAAEHAEKFSSIEEVDLGLLLERIGDARLVLIGETTHGTSEFYDMRARITRELVNRKGFSTVGPEGDWPNVSTLDRLVRDRPEAPPLREPPFSCFPTWMCRNEEVERFIEDLRASNLTRPADQRARLYGLDLYSPSNSIGVMVGYLEKRDPAAAKEARTLYSCFSPWERDPARYGRDAATGRMRECEF